MTAEKVDGRSVIATERVAPDVEVDGWVGRQYIAGPVDSDMHSRSSAAMRWALRGDLAQVHVEVGKLTSAQRDELVAAACIVVAACGGLG